MKQIQPAFAELVRGTQKQKELAEKFLFVLDACSRFIGAAFCSNRRRCAQCYEGSSLNGLKTFNPGRRKCLSLPVTMVRLCRRAVAAM